DPPPAEHVAATARLTARAFSSSSRDAVDRAPLQSASRALPRPHLDQHPVDPGWRGLLGGLHRVPRVMTAAVLLGSASRLSEGAGGASRPSGTCRPGASGPFPS